MSKTKNWDIGIVVLNYCSYEMTIKLVEKIRKEPTDLNIIFCIVDNASPNKSYINIQLAFEKVDNVEVILSPINSGYACGNNLGLRFLESYNPKYALVINNDVQFDVQILQECIKCANNVKNMGVISPLQVLPTGKVAYFGSLNIPSFKDDVLQYLSPFRRKKNYIDDICFNKSTLIEVGWVPGSFLFFEYNTLRNLNFFDESTFLFCEEQFLAQKTKAAGLHNYIMPYCSYIHAHSATIKTFHRIRSQYGLLLKSQIQYAKKYYRNTWLKIPILIILNRMYAFALSIAKAIK